MTSSELEDLSDEIILKILSNVDKKDLIQCSQVSKRFRNISYDQSLWLKVDLRNQSMSAGFLNLVHTKQWMQKSLSFRSKNRRHFKHNENDCIGVFRLIMDQNK